MQSVVKRGMAVRYKPEHKERTRQRIIDRAARLFRRLGYDGVGVDRIMAAAGLTRGGFYGYFRSKAGLFAAIVAAEHDFNRRMRAREGDDRAALRAQALEIVAGYLDPANRAKVGQGCHMASLSVDVARASRAARRAYAEKFRELAGEFARGLAGPKDPDPRALAAIALCVGGLTLARAVDDDALAGEILQACRQVAGEQLKRRR